MVNLRGQFAMMMLVSERRGRWSGFRAAPGSWSRRASVHAELTAVDAGAARRSPALPYRLSTSAMDHPGLVQSVAPTLGELGVNIESAETTLVPAPITGTPLFEMELVVSVPVATPVAKLRSSSGAPATSSTSDWQLHGPLRAARPPRAGPGGRAGCGPAPRSVSRLPRISRSLRQQPRGLVGREVQAGRRPPAPQRGDLRRPRR